LSSSIFTFNTYRKLQMAQKNDQLRSAYFVLVASLVLRFCGSVAIYHARMTRR